MIDAYNNQTLHRHENSSMRIPVGRFSFRCSSL